ncbi:MAG: VWA domain-containing protein [Polyangiaceae bacterium]|nr:VWA domain-containing protein [Polyangiaceae bacterium]
MSFATALALFAAVLVAAPIAAHLLRRRRADEKLFPPAALVPATPPTARKRSSLEDRFLFGVRALSILALALLGATPFVKCNRLSLTRQSGASVALAIIVDDSLSMRAKVTPDGDTTRFERAKRGAKELMAGLSAGDAVAIVMAGAPARVALAATTDFGSVNASIDSMEPSDRATDLDAAMRMAADLLKGLPQLDKRVVLLSDLADGTPAQSALTGSGDVTLWAPLPELEAKGESDCAVVRAERAGDRVRVRVVCTPVLSVAKPSESGVHTVAPVEGPSAGRSVEVRAAGRVLRSTQLSASVQTDEVTLDLPGDTANQTLTVALTGKDAIAEDDQAPVSALGAKLRVALVVDPAAVHVETGGAPPVEQALSALALDAESRPLPTVPDHAEELSGYGALLIDDAPGLTPEMRRAVSQWVEKGGVVFLTLGPKAAAAPLGAGFDPLLAGVMHWGETPVPGIDPASFPLLGGSAITFADLSPSGRMTLAPETLQNADVLAKWKDGAPFLIRRPLGRGAVLALTLPLTTQESDIALRPAFLALLDRFVRIARARGGAARVDAGDAWTFDGVKEVKVARVGSKGPNDLIPIPLTELDQRLRATPPVAGVYDLVLDGEHETRVATVPEREIDLRPRALVQNARDSKLGGSAGQVDVSSQIALALLLLATLELGLRAYSKRAE